MSDLEATIKNEISEIQAKIKFNTEKIQAKAGPLLKANDLLEAKLDGLKKVLRLSKETKPKK